jgi:hypothetical protein
MSGRARDPLGEIFSKPATPRPVHPAALDDDALLDQCRWTRSRSGGPGGQHRNKVETTVELVHTASGVSAKAGERRSVRENMRVAMSRLRLALAVGYRVGVPAGECRSDLWRTRSRTGRVIVSTKHRDYSALLAEAMDVLDASGNDLGVTATRLCVTQSQIVKLLREHQPAMVAVNERRAAMGKRVLR